MVCVSAQSVFKRHPCIRSGSAFVQLSLVLDSQMKNTSRKLPATQATYTVNRPEAKQIFNNNYSSSLNGLMRPKAEWAIDSEAIRARGIIVLVNSS